MINSLEKFMNWLTDMDWGWWPFLFLRPKKNKLMNNRVLYKMSLYFGSIGGFIAGYINYLKSKDYLQVVVIFFLEIILFFIVYKLTFAYFWNRRAKRLMKANK